MAKLNLRFNLITVKRLYLYDCEISAMPLNRSKLQNKVKTIVIQQYKQG